MKGLRRRRLIPFFSLIVVSFTGTARAEFVSWCQAALLENGEDARTLRAVSAVLAAPGCTALGVKLNGSEYLWLNGREVKSLNFLRYFPGISRLDLTDNRIEDLSPLREMYGLTHLWLGENEIEDLSPLSGLGNLQLLVLEDNQVVDASPLSTCYSLQALDLGRNHLSRLDFFYKLTNIRYIFLNHNFIGNIAPVAWSGDILKALENMLDESDFPGNRMLNTIQINWDKYMGQQWSYGENFRVLELAGNPILREFWESGYVRKKTANCPVDSGFSQISHICRSIHSH